MTEKIKSRILKPSDKQNNFSNLIKSHFVLDISFERIKYQFYLNFSEGMTKILFFLVLFTFWKTYGANE